MKTKQDVIALLDEFKAYSIAQEPDYESYFVSLMSPLYSAVNAYFNADRSEFKAPMNDLEQFMHNDMWSRNAVWEKPLPVSMGSNPPSHYNDLREAFYKFDWDMTPEEFYATWIIGIPPVEPPEVPETEERPYDNNTIDTWVSELSTQIAKELQAIDALGNWIEQSMSEFGVAMLWEDTGKLESVQGTSQIANELFINKHWLEVINTLNLPAYVPTYLRGG